MILTCPACTMRYMVSEGALGLSGRRVRCASCGHQWFEEGEKDLDVELFGAESSDSLASAFIDPPEEDDGSSFFDDPEEEEEQIPVEEPQSDEDYDRDFQSILRKEIETSPIPEGVRPVLGDPVLPPPRIKTKLAFSGERAGGFVVAAVSFLVVIGILLTIQPQVSRAWPPSNLFYDLVGMKPVMPGEGLSLENLKASIADGQIRMEGQIVNLKNEDRPVPAIMASIVDEHDAVLDQILIAPPLRTIKSEGETPFRAAYGKIPVGAKNVRYAFSFMETNVGDVEEKPPAAVEEKNAAEHAVPEEHAPAKAAH